MRVLEYPFGARSWDLTRWYNKGLCNRANSRSPGPASTGLLTQSMNIFSTSHSLPLFLPPKRHSKKTWDFLIEEETSTNILLLKQHCSERVNIRDFSHWISSNGFYVIPSKDTHEPAVWWMHSIIWIAVHKGRNG